MTAPHMPDLRIGGCPALAEMDLDGNTVGVMPCAKDSGHRPRMHEARTMEGDVRVGFWWDHPAEQTRDAVDGYPEPQP